MTSIIQRNIEADYKLVLSWDYGTLRMPQAALQAGIRPLPIADMYVPLRFTYHPQNTARFHLPKMLCEDHRLLVIGEEGMGKSTLIKLLTYAFGCVHDSNLKQRFGNLLPVPIRLRDYDVSLWHDYRDMLTAFIERLDKNIRPHISVEWLMKYLQTGSGFLLIDDLDGHPENAELRHRLRYQVFEPLFDAAPGCNTIATTTPNNYTNDFYAHVLGRACYLVPFSLHQAAEFINRWYTTLGLSGFERRNKISAALSHICPHKEAVQHFSIKPGELIKSIAELD